MVSFAYVDLDREVARSSQSVSQSGRGISDGWGWVTIYFNWHGTRMGFSIRTLIPALSSGWDDKAFIYL